MAVLETELREIRTSKKSILTDNFCCFPSEKQYRRYSFEEIAEMSDPVERLERIMKIIDRKLDSDDLITRKQLLGMNIAIDRGISDITRYYGRFDTSPVLEVRSRVEREIQFLEE